MQNRSGVAASVAISVMIAASMAAPLLVNMDPAAQNLSTRLASPSMTHWLGTDELGRDVLARVLYGGRATFTIVAMIGILICPTGLLIGAIAGYAGGLIDKVLMRATDVVMSFPRLALVLALVSAMKPGIGAAVLAISVTSWPVYARMARADAMAIRGADYIAAIRLLGAGPSRIVLRHVVPMCLPNIIVRFSLDAGGIILTVATLGFVGVGVQPPIPEWGTMVSASRAAILQQWWVPIAPGIAICLAAAAFNLVGEALRELYDPTQR
jgi:peptide/nickel transport system permease protein